MAIEMLARRAGRFVQGWILNLQHHAADLAAAALTFINLGHCLSSEGSFLYTILGATLL